MKRINKNRDYVCKVKAIYKCMLMCRYGTGHVKQAGMTDIYKCRKIICKYYDDPNVNDIPPKQQIELFREVVSRFTKDRFVKLSPNVLVKLTTMKRLPNAFRITSIVNAKEFSEFVRKYMTIDLPSMKPFGRFKYHDSIISDIVEMTSLVDHTEFVERAFKELVEAGKNVEKDGLEEQLIFADRYLILLGDRVVANAILYSLYMSKDEFLELVVPKCCYDILRKTGLAIYCHGKKCMGKVGNICVFISEDDSVKINIRKRS